MSTTIDLQQYLTETALVLRREGYEVAQAPDGHLLIRLSGQPICKVRKMGGITYRQGNLCSDELVSAKDQAYEIVKTIAEYMRAMENAPPLKVVGLGDGYRLLAEFNDAVLAGQPTLESSFRMFCWASTPCAWGRRASFSTATPTSPPPGSWSSASTPSRRPAGMCGTRPCSTYSPTCPTSSSTRGTRRR